MLGTLKHVITMFEGYYGQTAIAFALFVISLIYLMHLGEVKNKISVLVTYTIIALVIIFCPVSAIIIMKIIGANVYWRMFWLLPATAIIAAATVYFVSSRENMRQKIVSGVALALIFAVSFGNFFVYKGATLNRPHNIEKLTEDAVYVTEAIVNDAAARNDDYKKAVAPTELATQIRQYDATVKLAYGRNAVHAGKALTRRQLVIYNEMISENTNPQVLCAASRREGCNYIILPKGKYSEAYDECGYSLISETESYYVLYDFEPDMDTEIYKVTQHPDDTNSTFYTIVSMNGKVIVVDGGWAEDADAVETVIKSLGGHVDAWILSHQHPDHIGAFIELYKRNSLTIDRVYSVEMASPELCAENAPWDLDEIETLKAFNELDIPQLTYVHNLDKIEVPGFRFDVTVLNAYDDYVDEISDDLLNDGGMMFKITAKNESMLFCSDVGNSMSDYLIEKYGPYLASDYVVMGHHGNGGLSEDFYRIVHPKAAFFDAPAWLMFPADTSKHKTPQKIALMQSMNAQIYSFITGENTIILQ